MNESSRATHTVDCPLCTEAYPQRHGRIPLKKCQKEPRSQRSACAAAATVEPTALCESPPQQGSSLAEAFVSSVTVAASPSSRGLRGTSFPATRPKLPRARCTSPAASTGEPRLRRPRFPAASSPLAGSLLPPCSPVEQRAPAARTARPGATRRRLLKHRQRRPPPWRHRGASATPRRRARGNAACHRRSW